MSNIYGIEIDRQSELPLRRQIYQVLKNQITNGQRKEDEELPSTRDLAKLLGISRNTVSEAYEMLIAEGYVISRQGAPTRVAKGLCMERQPVPRPDKNTRPAYAITADFHTGQPDLRCFPRYLWQQLQHKASGDMPLEQYGYTGPQGLYELRREIAAWLFRSRGMNIEPEDIFITAGATHALHLLAELLCEEGREIIMEDPCHTGMRQAFIRKGCGVVPVPADEHGMQTQYLIHNNACAVYVTPSHQFPLGGILPATRRTSLIRFARDNNLYIIEDDYDSEFRYSGEPVAPLHTMDPQLVIYVGTFSKIIFPALRIGYVILPKELHKPWKELRTYTDVQNPAFDQATLAEFLRTRKLDRHIKKMRRIYGERRAILLEAIAREFGDNWRVCGDAAGLHLALEFPEMHFDDAFRKECLRRGIYISLAEQYCIRKGLQQNKLLLGYGHLEPEEIRRGVHLLHSFMEGI
jgi:GntR family transcriptional regulator/MocR family aminotransferase